jgi:hypothetical protein
MTCAFDMYVKCLYNTMFISNDRFSRSGPPRHGPSKEHDASARADEVPPPPPRSPKATSHRMWTQFEIRL